ncbi:hypothetical protein D3C85_1036050 [compost metagenome]
MHIESIIKRQHGHSVTLGAITYEFRPDGTPPYVADVTNEAHVAKFLAIPEGYKVYFAKGELQDTVSKAPAKNEPAILLGSDVHPSVFEIGGKEYALGDVVRLAFGSTGMNHTAWNELSEGERADFIDDALDVLNEEAASNNAAAAGEAEAREAASLEYQAKFGKKPHHKWSAEKIRAELAE